MIDLLKRSMNQRLALAILALLVSGLLLGLGKLESGGLVAIWIALFTAYYGEQAFDRWAATKETAKQ